MVSNKITLAAVVDKFVLETQGKLLALFQQSCQDLFERALVPIAKGGNMPVITGFLRSSFFTTLNTPDVPIMFRSDDASDLYHVNDMQISLTIADAELGDKIYGVFAANYAAYQEYGTSKMAGKFFVRHAAQQWPQIVERNAKLLAD